MPFTPAAGVTGAPFFAPPRPPSLLGSGALSSAAVWRADRLAPPRRPAWPTGSPALDAELPGGGWPASGLTELMFAEPGSGELRLLSPTLRHCATGELLWIAPPYLPYAPALRRLGWPLERLTWIAPARPADAAWAAEQALRARCCAAVLWWGDAAPPMLRRLQLAAEEGGCPLIAFRPWRAQQQASPAPLRLACRPARDGGLSVQVLKRRGPAMAAPIDIALPAVAGLRARPAASSGPVFPRSHVVAGAAPALAAA